MTTPPEAIRLTSSWEAEVTAFMNRDLSQSFYLYCWVDGVHFNIRLGEDKRLCCLVMVGVRLDGTKELVAIADGYRESTPGDRREPGRREAPAGGP